MKKVTIKDVAREAGVSIGTVSNTMNNSDLVSPATREKILEVAQRLNYIPNMNGKLLKAGRSKMLGLFTSRINGPYYYKLIEAIYRTCEREGYGLDIIVTRDEKMVMANLFGKNLDGVMICEGTKGIGDREVEMMEQNEIKAVFLNKELSGPNITSILFDSVKGGWDVTRHLLALGNRKICFISGSDLIQDSRERVQGFREAMASEGIAPSPDQILQGYFDEQRTYQAVKALITQQPERLPEAFVAGNDVSAIGCIKALRDSGYRVPEDVSVASFDDIEIAEYFQPPLTTMRNPIAGQGELAVERLIRMIDGEPGSVIRLPGSLVLRESCIKRQSS